MYINDPSEKAMLPEVISEMTFEEPRDYHDFFHDDRPVARAVPFRPRSQTPGERSSSALAPDTGMLYTEVCRFNGSGEHIVMAKNCPHFDTEDEQGRRIVPGWTVQSG